MTATPAPVRIAWLDGLRCLAIVMVIGFHYLARWTQPLHGDNLYPYGGLLADLAIVRYGHYGVALFFIISGLVIAMTLQRCQTPGEFLVRRYARLAPAMLLCAVFTWTVTAQTAGHPFAVAPQSFLSSITFIHPQALNLLTGSTGFASIDGAYWSLYVEVQFYLLAAAVYFLLPRYFGRVLVTLAWAGALLWLAAPAAYEPHAAFLFMPRHLPWFIIGIAFYRALHGARGRDWLGLMLAAFLQLVLVAWHDRDPVVIVMALLLPALVYAAMRLRSLQALLGWQPIALIGMASYSLYLLHQNIGVIAIARLGAAFGLQGPPGLVLPVLVTLGLVLFCLALYRHFEQPAGRLLCTWLLPRQQPRISGPIT